jgi:phage head maturation protease
MSKNADPRFYAEISKVDDEQRMVYGYASTVSADSQGERVTKAAMEGAITDYMKFANIREMHQPSAVGIAKSAEVDDKGIYIAAKVVDDDAWKKVKEGVYKGFSIGGKSINKVDGVISAMRLTEISLVDRPANPECVIEVWKGEGIDMSKSMQEAQRAAVLELADLLDKGAVDPAALLAFAKGDKGAALAAAAPAPVPAGQAVPATTTETVAVEVAAKNAAEAPAPAPATAAAAEPPVAAPAAEPAPAAPATAGEVGKAAPTGDIKKGMATTAQLALLLKQLAYLTQNQNDEASREKDNSAVPGMLHDLLVQGGKALVAMATEEAAELASNVDPGNQAEDQTYVAPASSVAPFGYSDKPGDILKAVTGLQDTIAKAGAKFSADTKDKLAKAHAAVKQASDHLDSLNYKGGDDDCNDGAGMGKAATSEAISKMESQLAEVTKQRDEEIAKRQATEAQLSDLGKQVEDLKKRFDKLPAAAPRGRLLAIAKGDDVGGEPQAAAPASAQPEPIRKADGSIDHEATAVAVLKSVHATGGRPLTGMPLR